MPSERKDSNSFAWHIHASLHTHTFMRSARMHACMWPLVFPHHEFFRPIIQLICSIGGFSVIIEAEIITGSLFYFRIIHQNCITGRLPAPAVLHFFFITVTGRCFCPDFLTLPEAVGGLGEAG